VRFPGDLQWLNPTRAGDLIRNSVKSHPEGARCPCTGKTDIAVAQAAFPKRRAEALVEQISPSTKDPGLGKLAEHRLTVKGWMYVPCLVYIYRWFVGVPGIYVYAAGAVFLSRDSRVGYTFESGQAWSYSAAPSLGSKSLRPM
jgi:hypothetical protein